MKPSISHLRHVPASLITPHLSDIVAHVMESTKTIEALTARILEQDARIEALEKKVHEAE